MLKWAGGKGRLVNDLLTFVPKKFNGYYEPFVGGGALFFALYNRGLLQGKQVILSDINRELIDTYTAIRNDVDPIINLLKSLENTSKEFYFVRSLCSGSAMERAARMIYLNKTCYNGLCTKSLVIGRVFVQLTYFLCKGLGEHWGSDLLHSPTNLLNIKLIGAFTFGGIL
jgi:DNA adenine methylase Dam